MSQKVAPEVTRPLSMRRPRGACRPEGGNRRLPVHHLTLAVHHPWTLSLRFTYLSLKFIEEETYAEKHTYLDAETVFFSSILKLLQI